MENKFDEGWKNTVCFALSKISDTIPKVMRFDCERLPIEMLWHVENTNLRLMGSVHVLDVSPPPISIKTELAYKAASRVIFEADLAGPFDRTVLLYKAGEHLSTAIEPATFAAAARLWSQFGLPMDQLEQFRAWSVAITLIFAGLARLGFSTESGVDKYFMLRAKADQKSVQFLETADSQLRCYTNAPSGENELLLKTVAENTAACTREFLQMVQAWKANDALVFEEIADQRLKMFPQTYNAILGGRNRNWMPQLLSFTKEEIPTLVIVGAMHLVGASGLLSLMRAAGYAVKRES